MADRIPLIVNSADNEIQELAATDNLDLGNSSIINANVVTATRVNTNVIDSASSEIVVRKSLLPLTDTANTNVSAYSLGDATHQWSDLWVSESTIHIGGVALSVNTASGQTRLTVDNVAVITSDTVAPITSNANVETTANVVASQVVAGQITATGNISTSANISAAYFTGNASAMSGLPDAYSNAKVAAYLTTASSTLSGNVLTISGAGTIGANLSVGNINVNNDLVVNGNLFVYGDNTIANVSVVNVSNLTVTVANGAVDGQTANGAGIVVGGVSQSILWRNDNSAWNISDGLIVGGNVTATGFIGDGSQLTGIYANSDVEDYIGANTGANVQAINSSLDNTDAAIIALTANVTAIESNYATTTDITNAIANVSLSLGNTAAPTSASDTGTTGEIRYDSNYVYVCVTTNTWKRSALATW